MKHLFIRLYALGVVVFISTVIGIFIFNIIGDMSKEVENAQVAFESLEKAIVSEVKASRLEDMVARQRLRSIANSLAIKGFVVQIAPSKGAVFSYPPDSSLFAIVNGNVFVKEDSKFLKIFRTEGSLNIGDEKTAIYMTMVRSVMPFQMIFLRSRTVFFLMLFVVLATCGVFIYLRLNENDGEERVYTDFASMKGAENVEHLKNVRHKYTFGDESSSSALKRTSFDENASLHEGVNEKDTQAWDASYSPSSFPNTMPTSFTQEPAYTRLQSSDSSVVQDFSKKPHSSYVTSLNPPSSFPSDSSLNSFSSDPNKTSLPIENWHEASVSSASDAIKNTKAEQKSEVLHSASRPAGLYSPKTGLGWKDYLPERLDYEIRRATATDQDMSLVLVQLLDVDNDSLDLMKLADIMVEVFQFKDMIFEYPQGESWGFAAILQDVYIDEAVRMCNSLVSKLQHEIFLTGQEPTIKIGITTRACRLTSASVLIAEAKMSLDNAINNEHETIVGYQPSAQAYRQTSIENDR